MEKEVGRAGERMGTEYKKGEGSREERRHRATKENTLYFAYYTPCV